MGFSIYLREHIPARELAALSRYSGNMTERCHDVHHHNLGMELVSQCGCLMNHTKGSIWEIYRQQNLLDVQHRAPAGESKSLRRFILPISRRGLILSSSHPPVIPIT